MYKSPFGSLFSSEDSAVKPKAEPIATVKTSPSDSLGKQTAALKNSKVIAPNANSLPKKKPYDKTTSEFKSFTTMESDDPRVVAEQSKILVEKNKQELAAFQKRLAETKEKTKSAKIYRDVLIQYRQLPEEEKQAFISWTLKHSDAIKKLNSARKLAKIKKNTKESVQALNAEIKHWENLLLLKKDGVDIKGRTVLKTYRPIEEKIKASPAPIGKLPKFAGKPFPKSDIFNMRNNWARSSELGSLEASDEAVQSLHKEAAIKLNSSTRRAAIREGSYTQKFKGTLPGRDEVREQRMIDAEPALLQKKIEKTIVRAKELGWRIDRIQDEIKRAKGNYSIVQKTLSELTMAMSKDKQTTQVVHALGILLEARPERFLTAPTLLDAAKGSFSRLSQLGSDDPTVEATPEKEAEELLKQTSDESTAELKELEVRQNTLAKLKAEVEDKPAPPPIQLVIVQPPPLPPPSQTKKATSTINKLLPWAAGLFLFMKLLEA